MSKRAMTRSLCLVSLCVAFFVIGLQVQPTQSSVLSRISGVWSGKSKLVTSTGTIHYNISALVEGEHIFLSLVATAENNVKFAFKLDLEYLRAEGNKVVFSVNERETLWLEQIRTNTQLDIPVIGHLLMATVVKINDDQFYLSYPVGDGYAFGTLFERGL